LLQVSAYFHSYFKKIGNLPHRNCATFCNSRQLY